MFNAVDFQFVMAGRRDMQRRTQHGTATARGTLSRAALGVAAALLLSVPAVAQHASHAGGGGFRASAPQRSAPAGPRSGPGNMQRYQPAPRYSPSPTQRPMA